MEEPFERDDFEVDDSQPPNNDVEGLEAPSKGMTFETIDEARKYYTDYGRQNGFWIRTRTSSKGRNRSNEVSSMLFVCAKEGKYVANIQSGRLKSGIELSLNKMKRKCNLCKKLGHDKRICPENPMSKTYKALDTEEQDSDSYDEVEVI